MNVYQHAAQIWSLLVWAARSRQTLTYEILAKLINIPQFRLGPHLEPIQSFCLLNDLPPLTCLVGVPSANRIFNPLGVVVTMPA